MVIHRDPFIHSDPTGLTYLFSVVDNSQSVELLEAFPSDEQRQRPIRLNNGGIINIPWALAEQMNYRTADRADAVANQDDDTEEDSTETEAEKKAKEEKKKQKEEKKKQKEKEKEEKKRQKEEQKKKEQTQG
mgnify:CR=1 FL=1